MTTNTRAALDAEIKAHDEAAQAEGAALALHRLPTGDDGTYAAYTRAVEATEDARAALDRALAAHVEAEVARRLAAAPEVESAIETHGDTCYERGFRHAHKSEAVDSELDAAYDRLRAAIAADKARVVEAAEDAAFIRGRDAVRKHPEGWGLVARPTPDEARRLVDAFVRAVSPARYDKDTALTARTALLRALGVEA